MYGNIIKFLKTIKIDLSRFKSKINENSAGKIVVDESDLQNLFDEILLLRKFIYFKG